MDLMDLFVKIAVKDEASEKVEGVSSKIKNGLGKAAKVGAAAVGAVTTAATTMYAGMTKAAGEVATYGDNVDKMSQKMGMSAEKYQEWDAVMQHSGTSMETMKASMKTLANAAETNSDAFQKLGISQKDLQSMSQEELFEKTISSLQNVESTTERTYLAGKLLGRGATELGALLNTSAEDTQKMRDRVHELGGVMSDDAVKASARYQDSLQDMQTSFTGLKNNLVSQFLPGMATVMDGIGSLLAGEDGAQKTLENGINDIFSTFNELLPKASGIIETLFSSIFTAITNNLPTFIKSGTDIILKLANGIITALPELVTAATEIIVNLANGISSALPELIPTIVDVVLQIVSTLTDPDTLNNLLNAAVTLITSLATGLINALPVLLQQAPVIIGNLITAINAMLPKILQMGITIIISVVQGLVSALPKIVKAAPQIITSVVRGFSGSISSLLQIGRDIISEVGDGFSAAVDGARDWGRDMIDNFISGIQEMWNSLVSTVSNTAQKVRDILGFSEPKKGPLSNFHTYAPDMMKLFAKGIKENEGLVLSQLEKSFDFGERTISAGYNVRGSVAGSVGGTGNVNVTLGIDPNASLNALARALLPVLKVVAKEVG